MQATLKERRKYVFNESNPTALLGIVGLFSGKKQTSVLGSMKEVDDIVINLHF